LLQGRKRTILSKIVNKLFNVLDRNGDGRVDKKEIFGSICILSKDHSTKSQKLTFDLFDVDKDGQITLKEMSSFFTAIIDACFILNSKLKEKFLKSSASEIGKATAQACLDSSDLNNDGKISFAEYQEWLTSSQ